MISLDLPFISMKGFHIPNFHREKFSRKILERKISKLPRS